MDLEGKKLDTVDIVYITLSGMFNISEPESRVYCKDLKKDITKLLCDGSDHPLIKDNFHFVTAGAFPLSEDVSNVFSTLYQHSNYLGWITGGGVTYPEFVENGVLDKAEKVRERKLISQEDYEFLQNLGSKIDHRTSF